MSENLFFFPPEQNHHVPIYGACVVVVVGIKTI
jgi:hypothetical protein